MPSFTASVIASSLNPLHTSAGAELVICEMLKNRNRNRVWGYTQLDTLTIITMLRVEHDQLVNSIKILRIY